MFNRGYSISTVSGSRSGSHVAVLASSSPEGFDRRSLDVRLDVDLLALVFVTILVLSLIIG